jgi:hypothetical protein
LLRHETLYSDIRFGDFWVEKQRHYDEGVSLVVLCSRAGEEAGKRLSSSSTRKRVQLKVFSVRNPNPQCVSSEMT